MNLQDCKKILFDFAASATQGKLADAVMSSLLVGSGTLAATTVSPVLIIPILLVSYLLCAGAKNTHENEERIEQLNSVFKRIEAELISKLQQIRDTEITLLEKEINANLVLKMSLSEITHLKELTFFILEKLEKNGSTLKIIADSLLCTEKEIEELAKSAEWIKHILTDMHIDVKHVLHGNNEIKAMLEQIRSVHMPTPPNAIKWQILNLSGTQALLIKTGVDESFDIVVQLIWNDISQGNCKSAQIRLCDIIKNISRPDSIAVKCWLFALQAKIYYVCGEIDKANSEAKKSEDLFHVGCSFPSQYILKTIYAQRYVLQGDKVKAQKYLDDILRNDYNFEAKALWLSISEISGKEALTHLSEEEIENCIILEVIANKFLHDRDFDNAVRFAESSFVLAKKSNQYPPFMTWAAALLYKKFKTLTITAGFIRNRIDPSTWSDCFTIIDLYRENLIYIQDSSDVVKSIFYHNLAMICFICSKSDDALRYIRCFFKLPNVLKSLLEPCVSILLAENRESEALDVLASREALLDSDLRFLFGCLLTQKKDSEKIKGFEVLTHIVDEAKVVNSSAVINSAIRLGEVYLTDKNDDAFESLLVLLEKKSEKLAKTLLVALKFAEGDIDHAQKLVKDVEPLILALHRSNGKFLTSFISVLKKIQMWQLILQLFDSVVPVDEITKAGEEYFDIAIKAKDYERIQRFGKSLRMAGVFHEPLIVDEITFTMSYSPQEAETLTADISTSCHLDSQLRKIVRVLHDMATVKTGRFEHQKHAIEDYPAIEDIVPQKSPYPYCNIPYLLKEAGFYNEAVRYAYNMYLRFPRDKNVRQTLYGILMLHSEKFELDNPLVVSDDSVFMYGNSSSPEKTIIIEKSPFAISGMKSTTDAIVKQVLGKPVGFEFNIDNWGLPPFKITSIRNKYSYVAHQIMAEDSYDPDSSIRMINFPLTLSGELDFSQLSMVLQAQSKQREQQIDYARRFFFEGLPSFYAFKAIANMETHQALRYFSQQSDLCIHSAMGLLDERYRSFEILNDKSIKLILSPLVIEVLILLDALFNVSIIDILRKSGLKFCVSEYIQEHFEQDDRHSSAWWYLWSDKDGVRCDKDHIAERCCKSLQRMQEFLVETEKISGRLCAQEFSMEFSEKDTKYFWGRPYFHTLQVSSIDSSVVLWDDDIQALGVCNELYDFEIGKNVFSQAVFLYLNSIGLISDKEKVDIDIFLITINEKFTSFDGNTLFELFFNSDKYSGLIPRIAAYFVDSNLEEKSLCKVFADATLTFATKYTNLRRAREGLKKLYDILIRYNPPLAGNILYYSLKKAAAEDFAKAKPIISYAVMEIDAGLARTTKNELVSLIQKH